MTLSTIMWRAVTIVIFWSISTPSNKAVFEDVMTSTRHIWIFLCQTVREANMAGEGTMLNS